MIQRLCLSGALVLVAVPPLAQELFRESPNSPGLMERERLDDPATIRSRTAVLNDDLGLRELAPARHRFVVLNLFEDVDLRATLERVPSSAPESVFLAGWLEGGGRVTLFITGKGIVRGEVHAPGSVYTIRSLPGQAVDRHDVVVRELDRSRLPPLHDGTGTLHSAVSRPDTGQEGTASSVPIPVFGALTTATSTTSDDEPASDGGTVDVVAVYTPHAEDEAGGSQEAEATIMAEVEKTNLALANSGLEHRKIRLVAMARADYPPAAETEYNIANTLAWEKNQTLSDAANDPDGLFDEVYDLRRRHGGDLVHLFYQDTIGRGCGSASGMYDLKSQRLIENYCGDRGNERCIEKWRSRWWGAKNVWAISGIGEGCTVQATFTHELGHNFGVHHDRYTENENEPPLSLSDDSPNFPITPYGFGYVNQDFDPEGHGDVCSLTTMAYFRQCREEGYTYGDQELLFSTPDVNFTRDAVSSDPAGVAGEEWTVDQDGPVHAARHIDEVWDVVAGLYDSKTVLNTSVWAHESFDLLHHFKGIEEADGQVFSLESSHPQVAFSRVREDEDGDVVLETVGLAPGMTTVTVTAEGPGGERSIERFSLVVAGPVLVPLFPAAEATTYEGFVRLINHSVTPRTVTIKAYDDANGEYGPVSMEIGANEAAHFNSADLERGNPSKGLTGSTGSGQGDWRLELVSDNPRLEVLPYVRTRDGFVTSMYDRAPMEELNELVVPTFNPASNTEQVSSLRLVNPHDEPMEVSVSGIDDGGAAGSNPVVVSLPAGAAMRLTSQELESGASPHIARGGLGNGAGKWRLRVAADGPIVAMSLLESPTGHLSNLSGRAEEMGDYFDPEGGAAATFVAPFFPAHGDAKGRQGFVRVTNRSDEAVDVSIEATDSAGVAYGDLNLRVDPGESRHFNSEDLESGNPDKGLTGSTGPGEGGWRLVLSSGEPALDVMAFLRAPGGFLTSMHDVLPSQAVTDGRTYRSAFFNPGSNEDQVSVLYVLNPKEYLWGLVVYGVDDANAANDNTRGGAAKKGVLVRAGGASKATSQELEGGPDWQESGGLGDGAGKWQLWMRSYETAATSGRTYQEETIPLIVMSLLENPTGHVTNLSRQDLCTRGLTIWGCAGQ